MLILFIKTEDELRKLVFRYFLSCVLEIKKVCILSVQDFEEFDVTDPNAVVVGLAPTQFHYAALTDAFRLIKNKGAPLIAIHKARYFATKEGLSLGPGNI
jgi:ribonucleotide monophosphatase NagD (HAD superfamily)